MTSRTIVLGMVLTACSTTRSSSGPIAKDVYIQAGRLVVDTCEIEQERVQRLHKHKSKFLVTNCVPSATRVRLPSTDADGETQ